MFDLWNITNIEEAKKFQEFLLATEPDLHVTATLTVSCFGFLILLNFYYLVTRIIFL